jgi:hypothetical protein
MLHAAVQLSWCLRRTLDTKTQPLTRALSAMRCVNTLSGQTASSFDESVVTLAPIPLVDW